MKPPLTSKQRAFAVRFGYHHQADKWFRWKIAGTAIATVVCFAWIVWGFWDDAGVTRYSHGPLAAVHATWEAKCSACHVDFTAIRDDAWTAALADGSSTNGRATDQKCQACHHGAPHHAAQIATEVGSCASCHREHQGRGAELTRVEDRFCTRCHHDLAKHINPTAGPPSKEIQYVTRFDLLHPEFRSLRHDPGNIKFTHSRHMHAGLKMRADDTTSMTLQDLSEADRQRYRRPGQTDQDEIKLECSSCHQLDSAEVKHIAANRRTNVILPADNAGRYMLPISYELHCRACHQLSIEPGSTELVPHGLKPEQIREFLMRAFSRRYIEQSSASLDASVPPRPVPGKTTDPARQTAQRWIQDNVTRAEQHLRNVCQQCHTSAQPEQFELTAVLPAEIPRIWLKHARFDHTAHRALSCQTCHSGAYHDDPQASDSNRDVLIADRQTCLECHSSKSGRLGQARYDCVECHRYHAGDDDPHHGRGAASRDATAEFSLREFLNGSVNRPK